MPTPNERKGLWFLALVALCGTGVRVWRARQPGPVVAERAALERQIGRVDSVRAGRHEKKEAGRAGVLMDINRAGLAEIEALPGIGPALAKRIVAHRDSAGQFTDLASLCEVRGVGPALAERLRPLVTFGGAPSPLSDACGSPSKGAGKTRAARRRERR